MSAGRICSRVIATASPNESIRVAARRMADYDVGTLVVLEGDGTSRAIGVVTDRDIALRCVARMLDPDQTPVSALMTAPAQSVSEHTPIEDAISRMASAGTRRGCSRSRSRASRCRRGVTHCAARRLQPTAAGRPGGR